MADINNTVGLDASSAIGSLDKLSFSIDTVNSRLTTLNTRTKGDPFKLLNQNAAAAQKRMFELQARINLLESELRKAGNAGAKSGKEITASWETVSRVLQTQLLVRGLSQMVRAFEDASEQARDFQLVVAQTAAIASGPGSSYDELAVSVRALAVELGRPLGEIQSAAFQALQNDIADTVDSTLDFVRASAQLALVTGSEVETAVNSLTSVLKSYGDESDSAAENADVLFRAIDVGRISLDELENRLGTITPQAAALGITFKESASAVSALTLAGLDTARASTQLRNILAKLIRPTQTLQNAFERLGVATGQQLVQQYGGLQGALEALTDAFDGNETAVANAFGTIRGQLGVLNLLANDGTEFSRALDEISNSSGAVSDALQLVEATTARDFDKSLANANDTLLGIGESILEFKSEALGLFNFLVPNSQRLEGVLLALGVTGSIAFANIAASAGSASIAAIGLTGPIGILAAALGVVAGLQFANLNSLERSLGDLSKAATEANEKIEEAFSETSKVIEKRQSENLKAQEDRLGDFVKQAATFYQQIRRDFEQENERIEISALRTTENFRDNRQDLVSGLFGFIDSIDGRILSSFDRIQDASRDLEDIQFDRAQRGLSDLQQATNELTRAQISAAKAREQFTSAGFNEEQQRSALQVQNTAEQQAKEALRSAERLKDAGLISQAENNLIGIVQQRIELEQRAQQALAGIDKTRAKEQADQAEAVRRRQAAITQELDALNQRRDSGGALRDRTPQSIAEEESRIGVLQAEFRTLESQLQSLEIIDQASLRQQAERASRTLEEGISSVRLDLRGAIDQLQTELKAQEFEGVIALEATLSQTSVAAFQEELTQALTTGDVGKRTQQRLDATNEFIQSQRTAVAVQQQTADQLQAQFEDIARTGAEAFKQPANSLRAIKTFFTLGSGLDDIPRQQEEIAAFATEVASLALTLKQQGEPAIAGIERRLNELGTSIAASSLATEVPEAVVLLTSQIQKVGQAIALVQQQAAATGQVRVGEKDLAALEAELLSVTSQAGEVADRFEQTNKWAGNTESASRRIKSALEAVRAAQDQNLQRQRQITLETQATAQAAAAAAQAQAGGAQGLFFGGSVFKNFGGDITRGQDQQLVAASAGEFFVNERSSSRFFSQLQAINAGQNPVFRDQGGPVTNIGDINVNVDASNSRSVDGREIARTLQREMRRNSSSFRG